MTGGWAPARGWFDPPRPRRPADCLLTVPPAPAGRAAEVERINAWLAARPDSEPAAAAG